MKPKTEHAIQRDFVNWCHKQSLHDPRFEMLFSIPNGGLRNVKIAMKMKLEGLKPGVFDLFLSVPSRGFHGAYIEMKTTKGKPSKDQFAFRRLAVKYGYYSIFAYSSEMAIDFVKWYLEIE